MPLLASTMESCSVKNGLLRVALLRRCVLPPLSVPTSDGGVLRRDLLVKQRRRRGSDLHQRALAAELHAADAADFDLVLEPGVLDRFFERFLDALGVGGHAAGGHAAADGELLARGALLLRDLVQVINVPWPIHPFTCSRADSGVWRGVTVPS